MAHVVLDASAVLAFIKAEAGAERVLPHIGQAAISAVNLQEVVKELALDGLPRDAVEAIVERLRLDVHSHDEVAAYEAGLLATETRAFGRGLGDRTCMALGMATGLPVLTADREWSRVALNGLTLELIR